MNQKIDINQIAKGLNIRTKRLEAKMLKMGLELNEDGSLDIANAIRLIEDYAQSLKTSEQTKEAARALLNQLNANKIAPEKKIKSKRKSKIQKASINISAKNIWYKDLVLLGSDFCQTIFVPFQKLVQNSIVNCVQILEGLYFKFVALLVAILVQMHHSAYWFYRVSPEENPSWIAAFGYAFMVDLFILVVTMEGKLSIAKTFAILTFLANVLYFQFWVGFDYSIQAYTNSISCILISGIMAYIIYAYTELFVKYKKA